MTGLLVLAGIGRAVGRAWLIALATRPRSRVALESAWRPGEF